MKFVSVSQLLGLALCFLSGFVSGPFTVPGLIVSLMKKKKKVGKKTKLPSDFKPTKRVLLVFLDDAGRGGWALIVSLPEVLRGLGPGLGCNIHCCSASSPGPPCDVCAAWSLLSICSRPLPLIHHLCLPDGSLRFTD